MNECPNEEDLEKIRKWDCIGNKNIQELLNFLQDIYNTDYGVFELTGKRIKKLFLATGGWSGNEDIISALQKTMFWMIFWEKSERGGAYYFRIYPIKE